MSKTLYIAHIIDRWLKENGENNNEEGEVEKDPCESANCPSFHNCVPDCENIVPDCEYMCEYDADLAKQYCELFCLFCEKKTCLI